jgi:hypothetical protein
MAHLPGKALCCCSAQVGSSLGSHTLSFTYMFTHRRQGKTSTSQASNAAKHNATGESRPKEHLSECITRM